MSRSSIKSRVAAAATNDEPVQAEAFEPDLGLSLREHRELHEIETLKQRLKEAVDVHKLRVEYTRKIFTLVCTWLGCVVVCVLFSGFNFGHFRLADSVLIAFITSTTVNVVGLFIVVAKWMYPSVFPVKDAANPSPTRRKSTKSLPS